LSADINKPLHLIRNGDTCGVHPVEGTGFSVDMRPHIEGIVLILRDGIEDPITGQDALDHFRGRAFTETLARNLNAWLVERWNREHAPAT
jgi:hypothetical protein